MTQMGRTNAVMMLRSSTFRRLVREGIIAGIPRLTPFIQAQASQAELPDIIYNIVLILRRVEPDYWMNLTPGALIYELVGNEWMEGLPSAAAQGLAAPKQITAISAQQKRPRSGGEDDAPASKKRPGADDESEEDEPEDIEQEDSEQEDSEQGDSEQGDSEHADDGYYEEKP